MSRSHRVKQGEGRDKQGMARDPKQDAPIFNKTGITASNSWSASDEDDPLNHFRQRHYSPTKQQRKPAAATNGKNRRRLNRVNSPLDDSDWVSGEEWKVTTDHDDEEETAKLSPNPKLRKGGSARKKKHKQKSPSHQWKPPRGNSKKHSPGKRRSQRDVNAIAAAMAEKHPWRKRRPSNGEDPLISPVSSGDMSPSFRRRPQFKSLGNVDFTATPEEIQQEQEDGSSVASSDSAASSSSSEEDSQSSGKSSEADIEDADFEESEPEEEGYPAAAFQQDATDDNADSFPLSFMDPSSASSPHIDQTLSESGISSTDANRFALEHRILLRAILQLLTERDHVGVEADVEDPENTIKKGPLKKFSHGGVTGRPSWKVKYVEIRLGSFSYFEDNSRTLETPGRKTIPLRANMCSVVPVENVKVKGAYGFVFELAVEDGPKRLWMANSEEERQAWIRTIRGAVIGGDADNDSQHMDMKLHVDAIEKYKRAEIRLGDARTKKEYLACLAQLWGKSLRIPVPWVREHLGLVDDPRRLSSMSNNELLPTPMATLVKSRVSDLWRRLSRESVSINGHLMHGHCPHGTERIFGALSRCILEHDRLSASDCGMSELQAIVHARNVLMAYYKSRSKDEAYYAVDSLCRNLNLVVCLPNNTTDHSPLHVQIYSAVDEAVAREEEKCGWVTTRSRAPKRWKNRYCIVSEGVLNYYEHCSPKPHGLRGQVILVGATLEEISLEQENNLFILKLVSSDNEKERELCFRNEKDMTLWKEAIEREILLCSENGMGRIIASPKSPRQRKMRGRIIKGATDRIRARRTQKIPSFDDIPASEGTIPPSDSIKSDGTPINKHEPTVQVVVESSRYYKIVTSGAEEDDTWAMVRANYMHSFLLSGGPHGKLSKGNELVEMEFLEGGVSEETFELMFPRAVGA